jgi:dihydroflavonol-4-reductase
MTTNSKVLVTGITGFLGSHIAIQLLNKNYTVVGTLRAMSRADEMRHVIGQHTSNIDKLSFAEADISDDSAWNKLMNGIDYVIHTASPFPRELPKHEDDLIIPAKQGVLNILKAASANGVKRVVLTSSSAAIVYGKEKAQRSGLYNENDWTDPTNKKDTTPYYRSKTIAEKTAWDFIKKDKSGLQLTSICPGLILGPVLEKDFGTSANMVIKAMDGSIPALPNIGFEIVDARSIADLHIRAMEIPEAAGERFAGSTDYLTFKEVADILREKYPNRKIPKITLPNFAVRLFANIDKTLQPVLNDLGFERKLDNSKAKNLLHWEPISVKEAVLACAESVIKLNIVRAV